MTGSLAHLRDPFEGRAAKRREIRLRIEGVIALAMAIVACGLTAAVWIQALSPLKSVLGLG
jgi:fructose-1,6-bisphosphatase/inositol monophosphatase family enzyme